MAAPLNRQSNQTEKRAFILSVKFGLGLVGLGLVGFSVGVSVEPRLCGSVQIHFDTSAPFKRLPPF